MRVPNSAIMLIVIITIAKVKVRDWKVRRSRRARSSRCRIRWRNAKTTSVSIPIVSETQPIGVTRLLSPYTNPPKPIALITTESTSIGVFDGVVTFFIMVPPTTSAISAIGIIRMNIQRQSSTLRMSPEMVGPIAGATEMTMEILPIIRPRDAGSTRVITVVSSSGNMIAVPLA